MSKSRSKGLTFIELVVSLAILAILASIALPLSELTVKRARETELREALRELRTAIDKYKDNYDKGIFGLKKVGASGYPKSLEELLEKKLLRKLPADPITKQEWGTRSFNDKYDSFVSDKLDVYDVYCNTEETALDGTNYKNW